VPSPRRTKRAAVLSVAAFAASVVIALVALAVASGDTLLPGSGSSYDTEFIDMAVLQLSWVVVPLLGIAAASSVRVALLGTAAMAVSQFLAMAETVRRYEESGWADGLEVLGYLFPITLTVVTLGAVLVGWRLGRRARARRSLQPGQDQ
jgi:hypothetical protein